jgi:tRNA(Ile)-lysidine synthase
MNGGDKPVSPAAPLHELEIDALFAGWTQYRRIALGVSGGADSMALMLLAHEWCARAANPPVITILTVDHGLRPESAGEAAWVKQQAARLGLAYEKLNWTGAKPRSDLQAVARTARYDLLLAFCRDAGIDALATAHTADDQAETLLMRLARGSGLDGLAAIAPVSAWDGAALLRPLLGVTRARLEASLRERGAHWIEDPSNRDSRYERVRVREALRAGRAFQLTPEKLALSAKRLHRARLALDDATEDFLNAALDVHPAGYGDLALAGLKQAPAEIGVRAIARMAAIFGGGMARPVRLARIEALYDALVGGESGAATLGGCVFSLRRGLLRVAREYGRIDPAPMPLPAQGAAVWDGRFALSAGDEDGLTARPLGPKGATLLRAAGGRLALPARIAHALPAIWRGGSLVFTPFAVFSGEPPAFWQTGASARFIGAERPSGQF